MEGSGSEPAATPGSQTAKHRSIVERLSRYGMLVMPGASQRRRLQRQPEVSDGSAPGALHADRDAPERGSLPPALRKKYLKELLLSRSSNSVETLSTEDTEWALYPMEHAWMLLAVEGNYETIVDFLSEDPHLLSRKDFISGYSVLHWLAKRGQDEVMLKLLRFAEQAAVPVSVNMRGSGGLTPLHVASMHGRFAVIKLLVGAFGADVDAMDYSGKRPWQYLKEDAPLEMKELLGTWDDEHSCGEHWNRNGNNNCSGAGNLAPCEELDAGEPEELTDFSKAKAGGWRFGSLRKLIPSFSFAGNKS